MNWSLLAGGVSKGLEGALAGANQGTVQGEQLGQQRADLGMRQEHLGLARQQLANTLAQQEFQNRLARERFGLAKEQLDLSRQGLAAEQAHRTWQQGHQGRLADIQTGELGVKTARLPGQIARDEAYANYLKSGGRSGQGTQMERWKDRAASDRGFPGGYWDPNMPQEVRAQLDRDWEMLQPGMRFRESHEARQAQLVPLRIRVLEQALRYPPLSGANRARQTMAITQANMYLSALRNANQQYSMGQAPLPQDQAILDSFDFNQIVDSLRGVQHSAESQGWNAANPDAPVPPVVPTPGPALSPMEQVFQKWNLGPIPGKAPAR